MKVTPLFVIPGRLLPSTRGTAALLAALGLAAPTHALMVTTNTDANDLVNTLIQPGITLVGTPTFTGGPQQGGTFTGGIASGLGVVDEGVILSSGDVQSADGPNTNGPEGLGDFSPGDDDANSSLGRSGDADLSAIVGATTNDAAALEFTFQFGDGSRGGDLFFNYIFASEEYIDFVDTDFNDVFALLVDNSNVGLLPGGAGPVTINNVNPNRNSAFYVNNVPNIDHLPVAGADLKYDGFTTVLQAQALGLSPGPHTVKFVVADTSDEQLDSAVLIQAGTLGQTATPTTPATPVPEPTTLALIGIGLAALGFTRGLPEQSARKSAYDQSRRAAVLVERTSGTSYPI